jgi:DinB superfamily
MPDVAAMADQIALLERTPRLAADLLGDLSDSWLGTPDTAGGWTPRDVIGHLISAELDDWIPRVEIILGDGTRRPFEPFDRFAHVQRDRDVPLADLLQHFGALRAGSLTRLRELVTNEADLDRVGLHPELGEVTLRQLVATWAVHDLDHLTQIHAALAGSQDAAVGPWKKYLGILTRRAEGGSVDSR